MLRKSKKWGRRQKRNLLAHLSISSLSRKVMIRWKRACPKISRRIPEVSERSRVSLRKTNNSIAINCKCCITNHSKRTTTSNLNSSLSQWEAIKIKVACQWSHAQAATATVRTPLRCAKPRAHPAPDTTVSLPPLLLHLPPPSSAATLLRHHPKLMLLLSKPHLLAPLVPPRAPPTTTSVRPWRRSRTRTMTTTTTAIAIAIPAVVAGQRSLWRRAAVWLRLAAALVQQQKPLWCCSHRLLASKWRRRVTMHFSDREQEKNKKTKEKERRYGVSIFTYDYVIS